MLCNIHVKNFALIDELELDLTEGLNILTGETGAGKSIIIDAVNAALGGKSSKSYIRNGSEYALAEAAFTVPEDKKEALGQIDCAPEDGTLSFSRRIYENRSILRINGENVSSAKAKAAAAILLDIHGQQEHALLTSQSRQLTILDKYAHEKLDAALAEFSDSYRQCKALEKELSAFSGDKEARRREADFLEFEISEIEAAAVKPGEEENLEEDYRRFANAEKIMSSLSKAGEDTGCEGRNGASDLISHALRQLQDVKDIDKPLSDIYAQLLDVESVLSEANQQISEYMSDMSFDDAQMSWTEKRLDEIRNIEAKYGRDYEAIQESLESKKAELEKLKSFDEHKAELDEKLKKCTVQLKKCADVLSKLRKEAAAVLTEQITAALKSLNFNQVVFEIRFEKTEEIGSTGYDRIQYCISTNPGQEPGPISQIASGGELSRIMLAIKTVIADTDGVPSLIFDEIDTGISGRTAQLVAERLALVSRNHQVICITHLPQIASMADSHYEIRKEVEDCKSYTRISRLSEENSVKELARMLGGASLTQTVLDNAAEMKKLAAEKKKAL